MENIKEGEEVALNQVELNREWTFWENYETKDKSDKTEYSKLTRDVFSFKTLIDFWQFWNVYPGAEPQNIFYNGDRIR